MYTELLAKIQLHQGICIYQYPVKSSWVLGFGQNDRQIQQKITIVACEVYKRATCSAFACILTGQRRPDRSIIRL